MKKPEGGRRKAEKLAVNHTNKLSFDGVRTPLKETRFHPARAVGICIGVLALLSIAYLAMGAGNKALADGSAPQAESQAIVSPAPEVQKPVPVQTTADEVEEPSLFEKLKAKYYEYFGDNEAEEPLSQEHHDKVAAEIIAELEAETVQPTPAPVPDPDEPVEQDIAELTPEMVLAGVTAELSDLLNRNDKQLREQAMFDASEMDCMARALVFETGGQPELGQRWVYHVIKNRADFQYRGNETLCDVVLDPSQISAFNGDKERRPGYITADVLGMVRLTNELYRDKELVDITCGATHYVRTDVIGTMKNDWARDAMAGKSTEGLVLKAVIGDHSFFGKEGCAHEHRIK